MPPSEIDPVRVIAAHEPAGTWSEEAGFLAGEPDSLCVRCCETWPCPDFERAEAEMVRRSGRTRRALLCLASYALDTMRERADQAEAQVARYNALALDASWLRAKLRQAERAATPTATPLEEGTTL